MTIPRLEVKVTDETLTWLEAEAAARGQSRNDLVRSMLESMRRQEDSFRHAIVRACTQIRLAMARQEDYSTALNQLARLLGSRTAAEGVVDALCDETHGRGHTHHEA